MDRTRIRKLLSGAALPAAAAAVCVFSAAALAVWFFCGTSQTVEDLTNGTSRELSAARQSIAALTGFDDRGGQVSQGWGFYAFSDNIIVTTFHTIDYCSKMTLSDGGQSGTFRVLSYDTEQDLAILKLSGSTGLTVLPCGSSEAVQTGDALTAVGNVPGLGVTDTAGSLAGRTRSEDGSELLLWASSVSVERGSPLLDKDGQVVGMITGSAENGLTTAIPVESIRTLLFRSETESTLGSVCTALHPGLKHLRGSTPVAFYDLVSDPERYEGQCIRLVGSAVNTEEYTATARQNLIFLMPPGSPVPEKEPVAFPWEGVRMAGYYLYWFYTPFSQSRILRCIDSTHTVKTARYQGSDVLVCGNFHYDKEYGYASLELLYTDTPQVLDILTLPNE